MDNHGERRGGRKAMIRKILETEPSLAPTVARICAGTVMFAHGAQKAFGWFGGMGWEGTMGMMTGPMGLSHTAVTLVILAELLGSLGLIFGCLTRIAALGITAVMVGAIAMVHWEHGFFMNWAGTQSGEGFEYHLLMIGVMLALAIGGAGKFSVDRWLVKQHRRWKLERDSDLALGHQRPSVA